jgi:hypothetical protein
LHKILVELKSGRSEIGSSILWRNHFLIWVASLGTPEHFFAILYTSGVSLLVKEKDASARGPQEMQINEESFYYETPWNNQDVSLEESFV